MQMVFAKRKKTDGPKHFRRLCDKKINALAMAAVLTVPDEALPPEISAGLGQLMAGLLKLLTTLKAQQVARCLLTACSLRMLQDSELCSWHTLLVRLRFWGTCI